MTVKALVAITLSLLLVTGLAVAQGPPESSPRPDGGDTDRAATAAYQECREGGGSEQECHDQACEAFPDASQCQDDAGAANGTQRPNATRPGPAARPMPLGDAPESIDGRFISVQADAANFSFTEYTVGNLTVLERISYHGEPERVAAGWRGATYIVQWDSDRLQFIDNPTGHLSYRGADNTTMEWVFPADAVIEPSDDGARIAYGPQRATLVAPNATWTSGHTLVGHGLSLHLVQPDSPRENATSERPDLRAEQARQERHEDIQDAISERRVAAQVTVRAPSMAPGIAAVNATDAVEIASFGEVDVQVDAPELITAEDVLRVTVSASLPEGRTIVLDIDPEMLAGPDLALRYFNVHDDGVRTEVVFRQADSLQDVLDPTDDDGQPEYWVVQDVHGTQVLVSIPHWSTHEITLASIGTYLTQPSVLVGAAAGVIGVLMAAAVMMWPRRRTD